MVSIEVSETRANPVLTFTCIELGRSAIRAMGKRGIKYLPCTPWITESETKVQHVHIDKIAPNAPTEQNARKDNLVASEAASLSSLLFSMLKASKARKITGTKSGKLVDT